MRCIISVGRNFWFNVTTNFNEVDTVSRPRMRVFHWMKCTESKILLWPVVIRLWEYSGGWMMRQTLFRLLLGTFLVGGIMMTFLLAPHAFASSRVSTSVPGCADWDYSCGYLHGFADGRTAANNGLCANYAQLYSSSTTASERGYRDAFSYYCRPWYIRMISRL